MKTFTATPADIEKKWILIDAEGVVLGRLATIVANILRGKNKPTFTPHMDMGDNVIVINADKIRMTGSKAEQKMFQTYVFYPSGQKNFSYKWMMENKPELLLQRSVRRMLPKNNLGKRMLQRLQIVGIGAAVGQVHVQITDFLAKGKILLAVQGQREDTGIVPEDAGAAIALVDIQIDHSHLQRRTLRAVSPTPFGLHQPGSHCGVIKDAETTALVCAGVVRAAGHVGGQTGRPVLRPRL